jgi:dienelactone hydrolase
MVARGSRSSRRPCSLQCSLAWSLAGAVALVTAVACSADDDDADAAGVADVGETTQTTEPLLAAAAPFAVESFTETFVDETRPTDDPNGVRSAPTRTLVTDIYVPEVDAPAPLIVHGHGINGHPNKFTELLTAWAEAGYVVAAPAFPVTNGEGPGEADFRDYLNQPADMSLVIDEVLRLSEEGHPVLGGRVDPQVIGVSGLSLGGITVAGVAFGGCCHDDRIDAAMIMDSLLLPFEDELPVLEGMPLLWLHLTEDHITPYDAGLAGYEGAGTPKYLVTLIGEGHGQPYEDTPSPYDELVVTTTLAFWETYLRGDTAAIDELIEAAESSDLSTLMFEE